MPSRIRFAAINCASHRAKVAILMPKLDSRQRWVLALLCLNSHQTCQLLLVLPCASFPTKTPWQHQALPCALETMGNSGTVNLASPAQIRGSIRHSLQRPVRPCIIISHRAMCLRLLLCSNHRSRQSLHLVPFEIVSSFKPLCTSEQAVRDRLLLYSVIPKHSGVASFGDVKGVSALTRK